jgi:hypothetical protein
MAIRFFFEYKNEIIQLPVNPEKLGVSTSGDNKTETVIKLGEINLLGTKKLTTINIQSFLPISPEVPYVLTKGQFKEPDFYINFFEKILADKRYFRLIITDTEINMLMSLEKWEYERRAGEDDIYYDLSLKEYKTYSYKKVELKNNVVISVTSPQATITDNSRPKTGFAIDNAVIVNGSFYATSYGEESRGSFKNTTGIISRISPDANSSYPYLVIGDDGSWYGWVSKDQLQQKEG